MTPDEEHDAGVVPEAFLGLPPGKALGQYYPGLAEATRRKHRRVIDAVRDAARAHGYALTEHGSLARDIDLVAIPWTDAATDAATVAEAIRLALVEANGIAFVAPANPCPRAKPHGRLCWSFHLGGGPYVDLSVTPRIPASASCAGPGAAEKIWKGDAP